MDFGRKPYDHVPMQDRDITGYGIPVGGIRDPECTEQDIMPLKKASKWGIMNIETVDPRADISVAQIISSKENDKRKPFELYSWAEPLRNDKSKG